VTNCIKEMTISEKYKFIFVEVGSSASTAIRNALNQYRDTKVNVIDEFPFGIDHNANVAHLPIWTLKNDINTNEYFKFAFFRNPWEVAVSKFFFHHGWHVVNTHKIPKSERVHSHFSCDFNQWAQEPGFLDMHYESKTKTMWDMVAKGDNLLVDKIFDFKHLEENWEIATKIIGIPHQKLINNKIESNNEACGTRKDKHYSLYYDNKTIEVVREQFAREIEYFNYEFEDQR